MPSSPCGGVCPPGRSTHWRDSFSIGTDRLASSAARLLPVQPTVLASTSHGVQPTNVLQRLVCGAGPRTDIGHVDELVPSMHQQPKSTTPHVARAFVSRTPVGSHASSIALERLAGHIPRCGRGDRHTSTSAPTALLPGAPPAGSWLPHPPAPEASSRRSGHRALSDCSPVAAMLLGSGCSVGE